MPLGDPSSPVNFGAGQSDPVYDRELFLDIFGGEVITAFDMATVTAGRVQTRTLSGGARSIRFPKIWKATSEYHSRGVELLGTDIETGEITITPDEILVSHVALYDLDEILSHFDVRSQFSQEMGRELARVYDKNNLRQIILASRTAADGPFPGGTVIDDASLAAGVGGVYDGAAWIDAIKAANKALFNKDVPETQPRVMVVNWDIFDAIKYATDANGNYLVINRDFGHSGAGGFENRAEMIRIDGVEIIKSRNMPTANETADTSVYAKYRADYSKVEACLWTPMAVANVKLKDISLETTRDTRRLEDFMVASMLAGHGTLRPECAVSFTDGSV